MVSSTRVYPFQRPAYYRDGPDSRCCTMRSTVYLHLSTVGFLERLRMIDEDVGTFHAEFACGLRV